MVTVICAIIGSYVLCAIVIYRENSSHEKCLSHTTTNLPKSLPPCETDLCCTSWIHMGGTSESWRTIHVMVLRSIRAMVLRTIHVMVLRTIHTILECYKTSTFKYGCQRLKPIHNKSQAQWEIWNPQCPKDGLAQLLNISLANRDVNLAVAEIKSTFGNAAQSKVIFWREISSETK